MNLQESQKLENAIMEFIQERLNRSTKLVTDKEFEAASIFIQDAADLTVLLDVNKNSSGKLQIVSFFHACEKLDQGLKDDVYALCMEKGFGQYLN